MLLLKMMLLELPEHSIRSFFNPILDLKLNLSLYLLSDKDDVMSNVMHYYFSEMPG